MACGKSREHLSVFRRWHVKKDVPPAVLVLEGDRIVFDVAVPGNVRVELVLYGASKVAALERASATAEPCRIVV